MEGNLALSVDALLIIALFIWGVKGTEKASEGRCMKPNLPTLHPGAKTGWSFLTALERRSGGPFGIQPNQLDFPWAMEQVPLHLISTHPYNPEQVKSMAIVGWLPGPQP